MALKENYLKLITSQHKDKPKFASTMSGLLQYSEDIFSTAVYLDDEFDLDLANGKQQDKIGEIISLNRVLNFTFRSPRSSVLSDEEYRVLQKARIIKNHWNGKIEDLYEKWMILFSNPIYVKDNQDMTLEAMLDINESEELQALMKLMSHGLIIPKPMSVRLNYKFYYPDIILPIPIHHHAIITQYVDATHYVWTDVAATENIFDGSFDFDGLKTFSGLTTQAEKNKQKHKLQLMHIVNAYQRNRVTENIFDGSFCFDGSKCFDGLILVQMPHWKVQITNDIESTSKQKISFAVTANNIINPIQKYKIPSVINSTGSIKNHHKPHRVANELDGGFCMDGSHEFGGDQIITKSINNLCTIEENGRIENL